MRSKINQHFRILILISPFIPLFLAVNQEIDPESFIPPVLELIALSLFIFSILYLLIELIIMKYKKLKIKVRNNFTLMLLSTIAFVFIVYLYDLWK